MRKCCGENTLPPHIWVRGGGFGKKPPHRVQNDGFSQSTRLYYIQSRIDGARGRSSIFVRFSKFKQALLGALILMCVALAGPVAAAPYAAMVMDARSGEVLHSRNADTRLHPASLTKMMTLYIAFEAVSRGEIGLDTEVLISNAAAAEPPSELGLRAGTRIRFRFLIRAAAIRSANDAATAIAEAIEGSEAAFARRMNRTALALGMTRTTFRNAHGLTEEGHLSTARDMTVLGRRLVYDYSQYYNLFSRIEEDAGIATVRNTNRAVLSAYTGADGIKTGFTRAAGFNLVASALRGEERIIATVFGGQSAAWRNQRIMELLDLGFDAAPSSVPTRIPALPTYDDLPAARVTRPTGAVRTSIRPVMRPLDIAPAEPPPPELVAAIDAAVGAALHDAANPPPVTSPDIAVAPTPRPDIEQHAAVEPEPEPAPLPPPAAEPEVVTRASSTGSRLFGISLGPQPSAREAEGLLLQTALSDMTTFDNALRRVVARSGAYEARFAGMTEDQAERACARLIARNVSCTLFGP